MKKLLFIILLLLCSVYSFSQTKNYDPWGIWDYNEVNNESPIIKTSSGEYYCSRLALTWIGITHNSKGIIAGDYNFPMFSTQGTFVRIENIEKIEDGFILHLTGDGIKLDDRSYKTKDNVQIQLKMVFISDNECKFIYISKTDFDGYRLTFKAKEDVVYRRHKVGNKTR